ncbi:MAG TPA: DJ-1/PfpI family protein [Azonexus sp.]|nr:DJ-1/PfpI family protein [Azonexus sp.]
MTLKVGILVFPEVEVLDFAGPYEVFTTASRVFGRARPDDEKPFAVFTVGATGEPFKARAGLPVLPEYGFADHPAIDLLIVPGGVVTAELAKPAVGDWISRVAAGTRITASVCTGAFLLAKAGLLDGQRATTHWEDLAKLRADFPALRIIADQRWVDEGRIVTSGGISAGIDMSLHLVERLAGRELALQTARQMEFRWTENAG